VRRIEITRLHDVVNHRKLILPQLGASGVAAHDVKRRSGFGVTYGPVRAEDLPAYLEIHQATPEMRKAHFTIRDRLTLVPIELVHVALPLIAAAILAGAALFPILLPWLPTRDFSSQGFVLGGPVVLPFIIAALGGEATRLQRVGADDNSAADGRLVAVSSINTLAFNTER